MVIKSYSCNRIQPPAVQLQAYLEAQNITQWHLVLEGHGHQAIRLQLLPPAFQAYLKAQYDTVYTRYSKVMVIMSYSCNCSHLLFKSTLKHSIWHSNTWYLKVMVIMSYSCNSTQPLDVQVYHQSTLWFMDTYDMSTFTPYVSALCYHHHVNFDEQL